MKILAFLLAFVNLQGQQQTPQNPPDSSVLPYQNLQLGLKFNYPKNWELTTNKKSESRILIPIENSSDRAVVEILPVSFRSETNVWQLSQVGINKAMKHDIERQWEEEILSVPLLLTKVNYEEKGSHKTSEIGLIYSFGFNKMMYRITSSPDEFDRADYAWRQVLLSLRTWDGSMPKPEDPSVKIERKDVSAADVTKPDEVAHPTIPHDIRPEAKTKFIKPPVAASADFGGHKVGLLVPSDWKVDSNKDGSFNLHNAGVDGIVRITLYPVSGSDPSGIALLKASADSLNDYVSVATRDELLPAVNKAGASVAQIWRSGKGGKGDLFTFEGSCQSGSFYAILTFRTDAAAHWKEDERLIGLLLDKMSVEPAP